MIYWASTITHKVLIAIISTYKQTADYFIFGYDFYDLYWLISEALKYIILMDPDKNIKNIKANLEFLKRFEGKKSVITRDGLISSLQSSAVTPSPSPRKIRINQ